MYIQVHGCVWFPLGLWKGSWQFHWADPGVGKIGPWLRLRGPITELQGYCRTGSWMEVGRLAFRGTDQCVSHQIPGQTGLPLVWSWQGLKLCHWDTSGSAVKPILVGLPVEDIDGHVFLQVPGPGQAWLLVDHGFQGWRQIMGLLQDSQLDQCQWTCLKGMDGHVSLWLPGWLGLAGKLDWRQVTCHFRFQSLDWDQ